VIHISDILLAIFRPEFEIKLKAYNDYFASDSKQQITVKNVSVLFFCST